jgi:hypothetical protein
MIDFIILAVYHPNQHDQLRGGRIFLSTYQQYQAIIMRKNRQNVSADHFLPTLRQTNHHFYPSVQSQ